MQADCVRNCVSSDEVIDVAGCGVLRAFRNQHPFGGGQLAFEPVEEAIEHHALTLRLLRVRSRALDFAVVLAALAGAFTCSAVLVLFLGELHGAGAANLLYLLFGGGIVLTVGALLAFVIEMLVAATGVRHTVNRSIDPQPTEKR